MPVSKKKHQKKRRKQFNPRQDSGYTTLINYGGVEIPDGLAESFHNSGVELYNHGKSDKANGKPALTLREFTEKYDHQEKSVPEQLIATIAKGQHSQYLDGYTGAEYHERVIFNRDF